MSVIPRKLNNITYCNKHSCMNNYGVSDEKIDGEWYYGICKLESPNVGYYYSCTDFWDCKDEVIRKSNID